MYLVSELILPQHVNVHLLGFNIITICLNMPNKTKGLLPILDVPLGNMLATGIHENVRKCKPAMNSSVSSTCTCICDFCVDFCFVSFQCFTLHVESHKSAFRFLRCLTRPLISAYWRVGLQNSFSQMPCGPSS